MDKNEQVSLIQKKLQFDPAKEIEHICAFIQGEVKRRGRRGVVIGLSGGLDSTVCAYLCKRCLPARKIHLVSLPERDSDATYTNHARLAARSLGLPLDETKVAELFGRLHLYASVPGETAQDRAKLEKGIRWLGRLSGAPSMFLWAHEYAFGRRRGFLAWIMRHLLWRYSGSTEVFVFGKVRARMLLLSQRAMQLDCLQVCTTDRSEWRVGFYDPHGDGVGDIAPITHLYKTQIRELARALGVPNEIIETPSSGDLAAGLPNEVAMGMSYSTMDAILSGFDLEMTDNEIVSAIDVSTALVKGLRATSARATERRAWPVAIKDITRL